MPDWQVVITEVPPVTDPAVAPNDAASTPYRRTHGWSGSADDRSGAESASREDFVRSYGEPEHDLWFDIKEVSTPGPDA